MSLMRKGSRNASAIVRSWLSSVRAPCSAPTKTTGKLAMNTVNTGVPSPAPNQSSASTSQAIGGVPIRTVTIGRDIVDAVADTPAARPSTLPATSDSAKPASARRVE